MENYTFEDMWLDLKNGYQIYSVQEVKISSEEAFLKKVGDKKDD